MDKHLTLLFLLLFVCLSSSMHLGNINDLVQQRLTRDDENKNLKLKVVLDSIRLRISDSLYLECPIGDLKPASFMFLRKDAVDFITRFSIRLNDTFPSLKDRRNRKEEQDLSTFLNRNLNRNLKQNLNEDDGTFSEGRDDDDDAAAAGQQDRVLLNCKWLSYDLSQEFGNLTLHLNKPKDDKNFNRHLYQYFEREQTEPLVRPKIIRSANKVFRRKLGDRVSFYCNSLQPQLKIVWYRKDEDGFINLNDEIRTRKYGYDTASFRITPNRLTIRSIQEADFAEYICRASNEHGDDMISYKLESSDSRQALIPKVDSFESTVLRENKSILLNCSITSLEKFGVQWFEYCSKEECKDSQEYSMLFIANNDYYRPMDAARSGLISHSQIQHSATYILNRSDLTNESRFICMVRNSNGLNYKVLTVSTSELAAQLASRLTGQPSGLSSYDLTLFSIILSIIVLVILFAVLSIYVLMRKSRRRRETAGRTSGAINSLNNLDTRTRELEKAHKDYVFVPARNKERYEKPTKNSFNLINNLVAKGRSSNLYNEPADASSTHHLNNTAAMSSKYNNRASSKFSSLANSRQRLNNTPVPGETFNNLMDPRYFEQNA